MNRTEHLENFRQGFEKLKTTLQQYPRQIFDYKPSPDKWSVREIILHIADSEVNGYTRCRKIISEPGSSLMVYDQDSWADKLKYGEQDIDNALDLFNYLRLQTYDLLKNLPEEIWANHAVHPERGKITLDDWLKTYSEHVDVHINQMNRNFSQWQKSKN